MVEHVSELFSAAYDRDLHGDERTLFDAHVAACSDCAVAYGQFRAGIDALRGLPRASMPIAVHLPSSPPVGAAPRIRDRLHLPRYTGRTAAALVAAVAATLGIANAVGPAHSTAVISATAPQGGNSDSHPGTATIAGVAPNAATSAACAPTPLTTSGTINPPMAFGYAVNRTDPSRPDQTLTLATTSTHVTRGSSVLVFARLESPNFGSDPNAGTASTTAAAVIQSLPCVALDMAGGTGTSFDATTGLAGVAAPAPQSRTLAEAVPTMDVSAGGTPLYAVTIPANLPSGSTVQLVATIPAAYPEAGSGTLTATLTLTVD